MSVCIPSIFTNKMKHPVRRCLFERSTAEKKEKDFLAQESRLFHRDDKLFREKWGLDPKTGCIVNDAQYECVPVDLTKESIPSFYTKIYARKPRPVQSSGRETSQYGLYSTPVRLNSECPRPLKRRYPVEDERGDADEICENIYDEKSTMKRVPIDGERVISHSDSSNTSASSSLSFFSPIVEVNSSSSSHPISSYIPHNYDTKSASMPGISPRSTDLSTPQQRPRSLTQKTMKDYLPCKKPRCATKI